MPERGGRGKSGQVLIITSLIVILLLMSTVAYVTEMQKNAPVYRSEADFGFSVLRLAALHTVTNALVNMTNDGDVRALSEDLARLESAVEAGAYSAIVGFQYTPFNSSSYVNGTLMAWGTDGLGLSSAAVDLIVDSHSLSLTSSFEYEVNVTTSLTVGGTYTRDPEDNGLTKHANVTCTLENEGEPVSAQSLRLFYDYVGFSINWVETDFSLVDYGNGTYLLSFTGMTQTAHRPFHVSVQAVDERGVTVWANSTLTLLR